MNVQQARQARQVLDSRMQGLHNVEQFRPPTRGWVRSIREALGMSRAELGARLGVTPATVSDIERSEADRRIKISTLIRTAEALNCDVIYALIPRQSLEGAVQSQARARVNTHVLAVEHTMELEGQPSRLPAEIVDDEVRKLIDSGRVWS